MKQVSFYLHRIQVEVLWRKGESRLGGATCRLGRRLDDASCRNRNTEILNVNNYLMNFE